MKMSLLIVSLIAMTTLTAVPSVHAADTSPMREPVKSVYTNYIVIQSALAVDSMKGVSESAGAIAKAVKGDPAKLLPPEVAKQAEDLAKAKDVDDARVAFLPLSDSLIKYLTDHKVKASGYVQIHCPMQNADWLQTAAETENPYFGKTMPGCGIVQTNF